MTQFHNRIRLPFQINKPQYPETRVVYRKTSGETVVQSIVIRKTYEGITDYMADLLHGKFKIMLAHDFLQIETDNYYGRFVQSGDYSINWLSILNYNLAQAKFQVEVTPFNATNANCLTCETSGEVIANNDTMPDPIEEDSSYTINVATNDQICCFPPEFQIVNYNTNYIASISIDSETGEINFTTKTPLTTVNLLPIITYRVICPSGNYDDANVIANVSGSIDACLAPTAISVLFASNVNATIAFTPPSPLPDHYHWYLYNVATNTVDQTDDEPNGSSAVALTGLTPATEYQFYIRSQCDATDDDATASNYISVDFTTAPITALCGTYNLSLDDPSQPDAAHGGHLNVTYVDCVGNLQTLYLPNHDNRNICAMQTAPGSPTSITTGGNPFVTVTYVGVCGSPQPVLTLSFTHAGSFLQFGASLSFAIDGIVNINSLFADGFTASDCTGGAVASAQKTSPMSIPVGLTGASAPPTLTSGTWDSSEHSYTMNGCNVNGTPVIDGSVLIIGSYSVLISIPACRP